MAHTKSPLDKVEMKAGWQLGRNINDIKFFPPARHKQFELLFFADTQIERMNKKLPKNLFPPPATPRPERISLGDNFSLLLLFPSSLVHNILLFMLHQDNSLYWRHCRFGNKKNKMILRVVVIVFARPGRVELIIERIREMWANYDPSWNEKLKLKSRNKQYFIPKSSRLRVLVPAPFSHILWVLKFTTSGKVRQGG